MNMPSKETLTLIKKWEGFRSAAYLCPANVWTIGYGTTRIDGKPVVKGQTITEHRASELLAQQVAQFQDAVDKAVTVPLTEPQLTALVSLAYNIGVGAFQKSTLVRLLNSGDRVGAGLQFLRWTRGGGQILPGLVNRRWEELTYWLDGLNRNDRIALLRRLPEVS